MIRMTSASPNLGIGRLALEQYMDEKAANDGKNADVKKLLLDRYNTQKTANESTGINKLLQDRYEKAKEAAAGAGAGAGLKPCTYNRRGIGLTPVVK